MGTSIRVLGASDFAWVAREFAFGEWGEGAAGVGDGCVWLKQPRSLMCCALLFPI